MKIKVMISLFVLCLTTLALAQVRGPRYNPPGGVRNNPPVVVYAPSQPSYQSYLENYSCQLASQFCGYNGGRHTITVQARSLQEAQNECLGAARYYNEEMCQVQSQYAASQPLQRYGCQTATQFCGYNGGRHTTEIRAMDYQDAVQECQGVARSLNEIMCQLN